jgi:hyperosmotically inducible periplasmic protein
MYRIGWVWLSVFVVLSVPLAASVSTAQTATTPSERQLQADITRKIAGLKLRSSHITIDVHDHTVRLDGTVPTLWVKQQIIDLAHKTTGVQNVESTIQIARAESDARLAAAVSRELQQYPRMTVYDIVDGVVREGVVTLTGAVTDAGKTDEIIERLEKILGVQAITSQIKELPVSPLDDRIRVAIASQIYANPLFDNYSRATPPIHVIVENGHVMLVGIVTSDIERRKADAIAHTVPGVFSVDDQIRLASELPR